MCDEMRGGQAIHVILADRCQLVLRPKCFEDGKVDTYEPLAQCKCGSPARYKRIRPRDRACVYHVCKPNIMSGAPPQIRAKAKETVDSGGNAGVHGHVSSILTFEHSRNYSPPLISDTGRLPERLSSGSKPRNRTHVPSDDDCLRLNSIPHAATPSHIRTSRRCSAAAEKPT